MSAAARITREGGSIVVASECSDGIPDHGNFAALMRTGNSPEDVLQAVRDQEPILDQWQAQVLSEILRRADVAVHSRMNERDIRECKLAVAEDLGATIRERLQAAGTGARAAVMPDGPLTIPYVAED